jgi:hypothetical protein
MPEGGVPGSLESGVGGVPGSGVDGGVPGSELGVVVDRGDVEAIR